MLWASSPTTVMLRWRAARAAENARLQQIRVLVFVDQNVVVQAGDAVGDRRRLLEHQRPEQQQVVVVDEIALRLSARVLGEDPNDLARELDELRVLLLENLLDRVLGVEVARIYVVERFLLRESFFLAAESEAGARELHQILGVALVHDGEVASRARPRGRSAGAAGVRWRETFRPARAPTPSRPVARRDSASRGRRGA